ncbi:hypothetical protein CBL_13958 [Carabus blaptoides fortunei]
MSLELVYGLRGGKLIKHENHKFTFARRLKNGCVRWRCAKRTCKVTLLSDKTCEKLLEISRFHNHSSDVNKLNRQLKINKDKMKKMQEANWSGTDLNERNISEGTAQSEYSPLSNDGFLGFDMESREEICDVEDSKNDTEFNMSITEDNQYAVEEILASDDIKLEAIEPIC